MNYNYGSMWRKWDLHIHTPYSILNNQFCEANDENFKNYFKMLVEKAIDNKIKAIGITDYFCIKGYKKVLEILDNNEILNNIFEERIRVDKDYLWKVKEIAFFPNIEFRLDSTIFYEKRNCQSKLQLHVILSNDISIREIESSLLNNLHCSSDSRFNLDEQSVALFGKQMIESGIGDTSILNELKRGYNEFSVDLKELRKILEQSFKDKYIIVGVEEDITKYSWNSQAGAKRRDYLNSCDAIFTSNLKSISWLSSDECYETIGERKACLWGSDAHNYNEMFNPSERRFCWIKADTTFAGLRSAINSVNERIYIGEQPIEYIEYKKRLQYSILEVKINRNSNNDTTPVWFDMDKPLILNPFMVSIIGNKGSGKSALADIISFIGNSYKMEYASFLNKSRFLNPKTKYYNNFSAYFTRSGNKEEIIKKDSLEMLKPYDENVPEKVQFLPQKYIEEVCNSIDDKFQNEIDEVIFSYIPSEEKLHTSNLNELIERKTNYIRQNIKNYQADLSTINYKINTLINKKGSIYINELKKKKMILLERLSIHEKNKPTEVEEPNDLINDKYSKLSCELTSYSHNINDEIEKKKNLLSNLNFAFQEIIDYENIIETTKENIIVANEKYKKLSEKFKLNDNKEMFSFKLNDAKLIEFKNNISDEMKKLMMELKEPNDYSIVEVQEAIIDLNDLDKTLSLIEINSEKYTSLFVKKFFIDSYISFINQYSSESVRRYFQYQQDLSLWEKERKMIIGDIPNVIDGESIMKYDEELKYIEGDLITDLAELKNQRNQIILKICSEKNKLKIEYQNIYFPIQSKIDSLINTNDEKIEFNVNANPDKELANNLLKYMNKKVASSFQGLTDGLGIISNFVNSTDFDKDDSIINFIGSILDEVERTKDLKSFINYFDDFSDYLCGLDYLNINYTLTLGKKRLNELSPGERGIVLLVFYLALNKSNVPLIIDQPEDNLDNQSVFTRLVPCIKKAKMNRQIIVVTHNPNIAVACDSEQIIYTHINKDNMKITYESGSLENPDMRSHVVDILEGTMPAFDMRKLKYYDGYDKKE